MLCNNDGSMVNANHSFKEMFSLPDEIDYSCIDFLLFNEIPGIKGKEKVFARGEGFCFESDFDFRFTEQDGRYNIISTKGRFLSWHITPLNMESSGPAMYLGQVQDITERKKSEERRLNKVKNAADEANRMVEGLKKEILDGATFQSIISRSAAMKEIFDIIPEIAQTTTTVLVTGESGTGKELVARSIHDLSPRSRAPFIAINCGALPDNLLESELFGYKAGAFTDAKKDKPGKFMLADKGTLFLDEIGDITPTMQVKLLRAIQEKTVEPLGDTKTVPVDVRIIAATNKDLPDMVKKGEFREDLFYRIKVLNLSLPALRDRKCDIPLLCDHFISLFNARYKKSVTELSGKALDCMLKHDYPGNIRELENIIEHAFIFCKTGVIEPKHLPQEIIHKTGCCSPSQDILTDIKSFEELERMFISRVLKENNGSRINTAKQLGIHKATLFRKMRGLGIEDN
jgi:transcriptional regulator with PAS, ATPase and Fis domain